MINSDRGRGRAREQTAGAPESATPEHARDTALKLWVVLSRAHAAVSAHASRDIARNGLTPAEFGVLELLLHKGPLLLGEIQRRVLVSSGGMTYVVDRLQAKGLVERRPCPDDRRASFAALTPAGEEMIRRIFPEHARRIESTLGGLDAEEQQVAIRLLRKLGRAAADLPDEPGTE